MQGAYFVVIARMLGVDDFGGFAGLTALVALMASVGSLGVLPLLIRNIVRDPDGIAHYFHSAIAVTVGSGILMTAVLLAIRPVVAPDVVTPTLLLCVAAADFFGARLVEVAANVYSATEQMSRTATMQVSIMVARLAGALTLIALPTGFTIGAWGLTYALTSVVPALALLILVRSRVGRGRVDWRRIRADLPDGLLFSVSFASQSIYSDIDKAMLARLGSLQATGIYTAAYRIVDLSFTPVRAILSAAYPRFFREGVNGLNATLSLGRRYLTLGVGTSVVAAIAIFATAGLVPQIFGSDYAGSVDALRALAIVPVLKALHYFPADILTGAGHQAVRSIAQICVALLNVALNLWLIPEYGYWGAVWATLACEALLALAMWTILIARLRGAVSTGASIS